MRHYHQAAYRPRDIAKQCETTRTSDQPEPQVRARFGTFAQVTGSGLIDLEDRRSGVQISPARPPKPQVRAGLSGPALRVLSSRCALYCTLGLLRGGCPIRLRGYVRSDARTHPQARVGSLSRSDQRRSRSGHREATATFESHPRHAAGRRVGSCTLDCRKPEQRSP